MKQAKCEVFVAGGTPAGIMSAVSAGRMGRKVILSEYYGHIGGMSASGLGKSDIENRGAIAGLFSEFTRRIYNHYVEKYGEGSENVKLCREGYYYEPSVAEYVFNQMVGEVDSITLLTDQLIEDVLVESSHIKSVILKDRITGQEKSIRAEIFIDATYEGDLYAFAGAGFRLGREGRREFGEQHAGRIFFDFNDNNFLEGSTGEADDRIPAYTYRLCMTDDPDNSFVLDSPPKGYNRDHYLKYFEDLSEGRLGPPKTYKEGHGYYPEHFNTMLRVFSFTRIPNRKFDVNINPRPLGFPFGEENYAYPGSAWKEREVIIARHRELAEGLIYFVQNDPEVPEKDREMASRYHLPLDEFPGNRHFPWQLYVREARRLSGKYTFNENDLVAPGHGKRTKIFFDSIISGEFPVDSFPVSKEPSPCKKVLEGYIGMFEIDPYQVPYRIMLTGDIDNIIVPAAASTTHVAFSAIRMEPLWMGIGQAAGSAAHLSLKMDVQIDKLPIHLLQKHLLDNDQVITYFEDMTGNDKAFKAIQFWGARGFFDSYRAESHNVLVYSVFKNWLGIFKNSLNIKDTLAEGLYNESKEVSLADFSSVIYGVALKNGIIGSDMTMDFFLYRSEYCLDNWIYCKKDLSSAVLRGEVCLALYNLFFKIVHFEL